VSWPVVMLRLIRRRKLNVNEARRIPDTVTAGNIKYYLNKGETNAFNEKHPYKVCSILHWNKQHSPHGQIFVDHGIYDGLYVADMLVLEGSERFVDVSGLAD
jgi:hypothetical protein